MLYCVHYNNHTAPGFSPDESTPRRTSGYTTSCKDQEASGSSPQSPRKKEAGRRATLAQDYAGHQSGNSFYYRGFTVCDIRGCQMAGTRIKQGHCVLQ
ncbi:hypothetical protein HBH96_008170 [Parastagonospora nodorum]|nr:hypothetical protein HBH96_008170 [Parastagonospora nodorum]KAH6314214.1 hypothetical protein HBI39_047230 [Parastagonospora nodorum]